MGWNYESKPITFLCIPFNVPDEALGRKHWCPIFFLLISCNCIYENLGSDEMCNTKQQEFIGDYFVLLYLFFRLLILRDAGTPHTNLSAFPPAGHVKNWCWKKHLCYITQNLVNCFQRNLLDWWWLMLFTEYYCWSVRSDTLIQTKHWIYHFITITHCVHCVLKQFIQVQCFYMSSSKI